MSLVILLALYDAPAEAAPAITAPVEPNGFYDVFVPGDGITYSATGSTSCSITKPSGTSSGLATSGTLSVGTSTSDHGLWTLSCTDGSSTASVSFYAGAYHTRLWLDHESPSDFRV